MRQKLAEALNLLAHKDKKLVFLTGDLGHSYFEKLQSNLKDRFINAGIAEQNMATVAAGLAYTGWRPWIFSIAPFITVKILEQLRNDICLTNANVKIIGIGGGYDYELAGPTHHALEDVGALLTLPNIKIYLPATAEDILTAVNLMSQEEGPAYIRLTKDRPIPMNIPAFKDMRRVIRGDKITVVVLGSILDKAIAAAAKFEKKVDLWLIGRMPFEISTGLIKSLNETKKLLVIEEHCLTGGLGQYLSHRILSSEIKLDRFIHLYAKGYMSKQTGSRDYYLRQTGLDTDNIMCILNQYV